MIFFIHKIVDFGISLHMAQYSRGYFYNVSMLIQILVTTGTKLSDEIQNRHFVVIDVVYTNTRFNNLGCLSDFAHDIRHHRH